MFMWKRLLLLIIFRFYVVMKYLLYVYSAYYFNVKCRHEDAVCVAGKHVTPNIYNCYRHKIGIYNHLLINLCKDYHYKL